MLSLHCRAIQLHPLQHTFWSLAAWWEFDQNANVSAARTLFLRGLRLNNLSRDLWLDYLRFELAYIARIKEHNGAEKPASEDSVVAVPALPEESASKGNLEGITHETNASVAVLGSSLEDSAYSAFLAGAIPRAVFRNAVATLPNDVELRLAFLAISREAGATVGIPALVDDIYQSLETDFPGNECIQALICERPVQDEAEGLSDKHVSENTLREAIRRYERALAALPTGLMTECYLIFLEKFVSAHSFIKDLREDLLEGLHKKGGPFTVTLFRATFHYVLSKVAGPDAVHAWTEQVDLVVSLFPEEVALMLECFPTRADLLGSEASIDSSLPKTVLTALYHKENINAVDELYGRVLRALSSPSARQAIWTSRLDYLEEAASEERGLIKRRFEEALSGALTSDALVERYLSWVVQNCPGEVREIGATFLAKAGPKNALLRTLINLEKRQLSVDVSRIRNFFETLITEDARDHHIWLEYIQFETERREFERASALYCRALKSVEKADIFVASYEALK